jgi:tetratricopeptide (TPR) repeat protein
VRIKAHAREREDWEGVALALDAELRLRAHDGDVPGVRNVLQQLKEVLVVGDREACALAHQGLAVGLFFGDPDEALRSGLDGVQMSEGGPLNQRLTALNRLIIVLYHRGVLGHDSSHAYVREALDLAERSGDRLQRYSLESNLAAQVMDAGDLERADVMLKKAGRLFGSADMTSPRVNHAFNVGELAVALGDFARAKAAFTEAREMLGTAKPRYTNDFVNAGLGLCALETGALASARRHEENLGDTLPTWYFDPTIIVSFRSRMLTLRGCHDEAQNLLGSTAEDLEDRLCLGWLKVRSLQARLMRQRSPLAAREMAHICLAKARELRLPRRVAELSLLMDSLSRKR